MQAEEGVPNPNGGDAESLVLEHVAKLSATTDIKQLDRVFLEGACSLLPFDYVLLHLVTAKGRESRFMRGRDPTTLRYQSSWRQDALSDRQALLVRESIRVASLVESAAGRDRRMVALSRQSTRGSTVSVIAQYPRTVDRSSVAAFDAFSAIYLNFREFIDTSQRDPLTGLLNRRYFDDCIADSLDVLSSGNQLTCVDPLRRSTDSRHARHWLAILDIDHFKRFNDAYGHLYGDEILLLFSRIMERTFRESDLLFRFGGEEFVVIMENASAEEAMGALERFRAAIHDYRFPGGETVTVSCGAIEIKGSLSPAWLLGKADEALYYVKKSGRNRTEMYEDLVAQGKLSEQVSSAGEVELFQDE